MKIYLPNQSAELIQHSEKRLTISFESFLPMATNCQYEFQDGQILIQELSSELFSIVAYEAINRIEQQLEFELPESVIALFFTLQGSVTIQQSSIPPFTQEAGKYVLVYCPANTKLIVSLPRGNILLFRIDYPQQTLHELAEDYLLLQTMLREAAKGSSLSRRLYSAIIDPFVRVSIKQIFEYGETKSERSLLIYARCIDLLRHYIHSMPPPQWYEMKDGRTTSDQMMKVALYIDQHLYSNLSKDNLAKSNNLSVRSLERHFLHYFGQSLGKYMLARKLMKAQELIRKTTLPLLDIAMVIGYSEWTNFTRAFKAFYGYPPSKLRK